MLRASLPGLACALLLLGGCGGDREAQRPQGDEPTGDHNTFSGGPPGGVLVVLSDREPDNLNPLTYDSHPAHQLVRLMFRALGRRDSTLSNYVPDFLARWETPDPATVILHVRPDLRWHDGRPARAEDVVFTIERQKDERVASSRQADVDAVASVRALDSLTVEVKLSRTGVAAVNSLLEVVPAPRHLLGDVAPDQLRFAEFNQNPVGSGLFRFVRWDKNQQVVLAANPDAPDGRPSLDRIVVRVVPDASARLTQLLNGEGDMTKVSAEQADAVRATPNVELHSAARVRPGWLAWNVERPPVDDVRVRQAILMGIDREGLARGMFGEHGEAALSPIPPRLREHSADVRPLPYDAARAQALLEQAGWRDTNGDGVREKDGRPLRVEVEYSASDPVRADMIVAIQAQLRRIGVQLVPRAMESTTWVERLRGRQFMGSFWGWGWGPGVVSTNARMLFHSQSVPPGGPNFAGYRNPRMDALIDSVSVMSDTARARQLWRQIEQLAIDEAVYAPIFLDPEFYAVSQRFRNVRFRGADWWEDVIFWWVPENQRLPRDRVQ